MEMILHARDHSTNLRLDGPRRPRQGQMAAEAKDLIPERFLKAGQCLPAQRKARQSGLTTPRRTSVPGPHPVRGHRLPASRIRWSPAPPACPSNPSIPGPSALGSSHRCTRHAALMRPARAPLARGVHPGRPRGGTGPMPLPQRGVRDRSCNQGANALKAVGGSPRESP